MANIDSTERTEFEARVAPLHSPAHRRFSSREFDFKAAQMMVFVPLLGVRFEFVCIKNQFVLSTQKVLNSLFAIDGLVRSLYFSIFFPFPRLFPLAASLTPSVAAYICHRSLATTRIGYRKVVGVSRKKVPGTKWQIPGVRSCE
jgi:hypothetical protein